MRPPLSARPVVGGFFLLTWLLGGLWALATPITGVPDEPAHIARAASVVRGEVVPSSTTSDGQGLLRGGARVPETLAYPSPPCFAFTRSLSCVEPVTGRGDVLVRVPSPAGRYNPAYYAVVGIPTLVRPGEATVYVMRFLTAAIVACLLTLGVTACRELDDPRWAVVGFAAAVTPMTLFLAGSVNPSAVEIAAALALWATLLIWFSNPEPDLERSRAIRAVVGATVLVSTRAIAPLFLVIIVAGSLLVAPRVGDIVRRRSLLAPSLLVAGATGLALAWTIGVGSVAPSEVTHPELQNPRRYLYSMVLSLDDFERQMIGVFGWLDTPAPEHVFLAWFVVIGFLVVSALAIGRRRNRVLLLVLMALSAILPILVQWPEAASLGLVWQGRYLLPVMVGLPLAAGVVLASSSTWNRLFGGPWAFWSIVVTLAAAHVVSFWWALHRNVIGLSGAWIGFTPVWQPPLGWIPSTLVFAAAVAAWTALLARIADGRASVDPAPEQGAEHA